MSKADLWIVGRRVIAVDGVGPRAIGVRGGVISALVPLEAVPAGAPVVDAGESVVIPGVVDTHVHVNEPGRTEWEGFATATRAAAAGGVTTIVDMPLNSIPATTSVASLEAKAASMDGKLAVDVGLWGGAVPGNAGELPAMVRAGALGFKCFMVDSGVDEFPLLDAGGIKAAMRALASLGVPLLAHAELPGPIAAALARVDLPRDVETYLRWLASRPRAAEDEAVALLAALAAETGARTHVVHLSSAGALDTLRHARDRGVPLTAETAPHYLSFESEAIPDGATQYKCAPPIREHDNREALWRGLDEGTLTMVVTDHSPCTPELKRGGFDAAWGGIASLQLGLSAVWTEASARGVPLSRVVEWMCAAPARLAGLAGRKGTIAVGADADLVFFSPDATFAVDPSKVEHRHKVTPYAGRTLRGVVERTFLRGEQAGRGRWVR